jgi:hypothetical protein
MNPVSNEDDCPHPPSEDPTWRESYYFNFVDRRSGLSGFSTIGLLPGQDKREMVFALFHEGKRHIYYAEPKYFPSAGSPGQLSDAQLSFEMIEPFMGWRIKFSGNDLFADIKWTRRFPPYYFGSGSGTSWSGHFEQSGSVFGSVKLPDGRDLQLEGLGQRDKSWGPRDWHIGGWFALHAQFDSFSIGLRRDTVAGVEHLSGGISSEVGHVAISKVELTTEYAESDPRIPIGARSHIVGADGSRYTLQSSLISPASFARFSRPFPGGTTELFELMVEHKFEERGTSGTGLLEWLFTRPELRH